MPYDVFKDDVYQGIHWGQSAGRASERWAEETETESCVVEVICRTTRAVEKFTITVEQLTLWHSEKFNE